MSDLHPNLALLAQLDTQNMAVSAHLFADGVVFHYFNSNLPELQGEHHGRDGVRAFFEALAEKSHGTFWVEPVFGRPVGRELVVVHSQNALTLNEQTIIIDVVVVWRIVGGLIVEVWDIVPSQPTEVQDA
ncbi:MAG: nuclear transport factor 2 family protein [Pseudomonadota bacterium]